jgi:MFS family permease
MAMGLLGAGLLYLFLPALPSLAWLTVLYALAAVGWAMSLPAETAMVADLTEQDERGRAYGLYEFMGSLGAAFGPLIGGALYDSLGKAVPFYLVGGILLFSAAWILLVLRQQREPEPVTAVD